MRDTLIEKEHSLKRNIQDCHSVKGHWNKLFFVFQHGVFSLSQGPAPDAKIGLWTLSPPSSAVLPHPEPTIPFLPLVSGFPP